MNRRVIIEAVCLICVSALLLPFGATDDIYQRIRKSCRYDSDCIRNAFCKEQTYCQCKENFIISLNGTNNFLCLREATEIGDLCEDDIQCKKPFGSNAECKISNKEYKTCNCMSDSHFKDKLCYKTSKIGANCRVTNNCYLASGLPAYCEKSICRCPLKYHANSDGTDCIKSANLDEPCANDMECVTENSKCGEVCRCRVNYIQSHRNDSCIEAADSMGDPCQENEQCTMFLLRATCGEDGKCRCETGFHHIPPNSKCHRDLFLGEMCELHEECITQFSECKSGTCQCKQNYKQNREECIFVGSNDGDYASRYSLHLLLFTFLLVYFKG